MRRFLIVLAGVFVGSVALFGAWLAFLGSLTRADPYPTFMTDYQLAGSHSYEEAKRSFSDFVIKTFPIGSDAKDAIAQITKGGFLVTRSGSETVELLWKRHNGPCSEWYSIVVGQKGDGKIAEVIGRLNPICL
jgi:hypothetical protein